MEDLQKASVAIACPGFGPLFWDESTQTFLGVPSSGPCSSGRTVSILYSRASWSTASPGSTGRFRNGHVPRTGKCSVVGTIGELFSFC